MKALLIALWVAAGALQAPVSEPVTISVEHVQITVPAAWTIVTAEAASENMQENFQLNDQALQRRLERASRQDHLVAIRYAPEHEGINPTIRLMVTPMPAGASRDTSLLMNYALQMFSSGVDDFELDGAIVPVAIGDARGSMASVRYTLPMVGGSLPAKGTVRLLMQEGRVIYLGIAMGAEEPETTMRDVDGMIASLRIGAPQ